MKRRSFLQNVGKVSAGAAMLRCAGDPDVPGTMHGRMVDNATRAMAEYRKDTKIAHVRVHQVHLTKPDYGVPKDHPLAEFRSSSMTGKWSTKEHPRGGWGGPYTGQTGMSIVEVETRDGLRGFGLAGGGLPMQLIAEKHLAQVIKDRNPFDVLDIWNQMYDVTIRFGRAGIAIMAISGIDLALWDIAGKAAGVPVSTLLGGRQRDVIPAYGTGADLAWYVQQGLQAVKAIWPYAPRDGETGAEGNQAFIRKVRDLIGLDTDLMTECSMKWDVSYTLAMADQARALDLYWIEEALMPHDYDGYARLCREVDSTRIVSGEHEFAHHGFKVLIDRQAADVVQPDIAWTGGLTAMLHINDLAQSAGLPVFPHSGGTVWALQYMAAAENAPVAETFGVPRKPLSNALYELIRPVPIDGKLRVSNRPGFGMDITDALLDEYRKD
jgi:L-rhamnonate dehydratase